VIAVVDPDDLFGARIDVRPVFERTRREILRGLASLEPGDWGLQTAATPWTVHDVVAHMVGDDLNRLSRSRDRYVGDGPAAHEDLAAFINRINHEWTRATARLSPPVLRELLDRSTSEVIAFWRGADLDDVGEPVTWVSPQPAPVWLDCARDFTEYWLHHRQIEDALGLLDPVGDDGTHEVLDILLRAMPLTLGHASADEPPGFGVQVNGAGGGWWVWHRRAERWVPAPPDGPPHTWIRFERARDLWRLCARMISPSEAAAMTTTGGDSELARKAVQIVSIIR
jgi:uncharacterized protein (TIGR03083 family)